MRVYGRLSLYGEYLMHELSCGLMIRSSLYLASMSDSDAPELMGYSPENDAVAKILRQQGVNVAAGLRGNMWLGYGLASSTAAALIYLSEAGARNIPKMLGDVDRAVHGYEPSGVDAECVVRQCDGLYGHGTWQNIASQIPSRTLIKFPKEGAITRVRVSEAVRGAKNQLVPLAEEMSVAVIAGRTLPFDKMLSYAQTLSALGIYSEAAQRFVDFGLRRELVVKCIGSLYDKATLVLWPTESTMLKQLLLEEAVRLGAMQFVDQP